MGTAIAGGGPDTVPVSAPPPIGPYIITPHARWEIERRGLDIDVVNRTVTTPEQQLTVTPGRVVAQSRYSLGTPPRQYLVRVVVDTDRFPAEVVTAYRTSKVAKYWRAGP